MSEQEKCEKLIENKFKIPSYSIHKVNIEKDYISLPLKEICVSIRFDVTDKKFNLLNLMPLKMIHPKTENREWKTIIDYLKSLPKNVREDLVELHKIYHSL